MEAIFAAINTAYVVVKIGLIFTTTEEVFITARIASIFVSLTTVHVYDFHIFTVMYAHVFFLRVVSLRN